MTDINALKGRVVAAGYTLSKFADKIRIPYSTFSRRLHSGVFGSDEIERIAKVLNLSPQDIANIFFN